MEILLTNDDGVLARGLLAVRDALATLGTVWVVAPEQEQSGTSHSLTLHRPLRVRRIEERVFSVDGTPTDCVLLACRGLPDLTSARIDLVVSGINHGPNLGDDISYSGTVAAAMEGVLLGRPSLAISASTRRLDEDFAAAATIARRLVATVAERSLPPGVLLNVNVPGRPLEEIRGFKVTRLGKKSYTGQVVQNVDPRGRPYYWIGEEAAVFEPQPDADFTAVDEGYVSITPVHLDLTDHAAIAELSRWSFDGKGSREAGSATGDEGEAERR
ncbi:MAG: 5'/3'-nucleotidase SurE [Candidatus Eisenbacteria bacterium]|nr:5'/3'-nucleotidase SurE [Candidatus Eisenbacteria bacterium]